MPTPSGSRRARRFAGTSAYALALGLAGSLACALALGLAGCGGGRGASPSPPPRSPRLPPDVIPVPAGRTPAYHLPALPAAAARRAPIAGLRCTRSHPRAYGVHLDLYARRLVLPVPAGIGVGPPQRRSGAYVLGGACAYPIRTYEPTGVVVIDAGRDPALATLFAVWGQPLSTTRLAGFHGSVLAFVDGHRWRGGPGAIRLTRHAEVVIEIDGYLPPHPSYRFEPGL